MMVEWVDAANGDKVIRFDGRLLASRFDPRKEAGEWLDSRPEFLAKVRTIIVLGMGAGYHVAELLERTGREKGPKILVIETNEKILNAGQMLHQFPANRVIFEQVRSARALRASVQVKKAVAESFVVLAHPASMVNDQKLFEECRLQLLGRDWGALSWQWKLRNAPDFDANSRIDMRSQPLTIHDLEQTELVSNSEERERMLFKALRELVK